MSREERAELARQPFLDSLSKDRRKDLLKEADALIRRHGPEGLVSTMAVPDHVDRAEQRRVLRALGHRGRKAKRHNYRTQAQRAAMAMAMDQALTAATARREMGTLERAGFRLKEARR